MADQKDDYLADFKFEDYAKKVKEQNEVLDEEIQTASDQQETREKTQQEIDWEKRYKDLEAHNSRQAQELGSLRNEVGRYKTAFDEYLLNEDDPDANAAKEVTPITSDDLFERPDEVINSSIDNHPAIRQARELAEAQRKQAIIDAKTAFETKHPKYQEIVSDPAFADWVKAEPTRIHLAQQADKWDFGAADALFSLYEAERKLESAEARQKTDREMENAALESAGVGEPPPDAKYSRTEMREKMIAARRGDLEAERYLNSHLPKYRVALANGQVTD